MTPEAALTKLSYVLSKDWDIEKKRQMMQESLRGEITVYKHSLQFPDVSKFFIFETPSVISL